MKVRITLSVLCFFMVGTNALSCKKCNETVCKEATNCAGSTVLNFCGCCLVCAKQEKELCGGPWNVLGRCDSDLACVTHLNTSMNPSTPPDEEDELVADLTFDQRDGLCEVYYDNCSHVCDHTNSSKIFSTGFSKFGRSAVFLNERTGRGYYAYCDCSDKNEEAWMVVQRRTGFLENFDRKWIEYLSGFGDVNGDYWLGLEMISLLTNLRPHEMEIRIKYGDSSEMKKSYGYIFVGSELTQYRLSLKMNNEAQPDGFVETHDGMQFSTKDVDNDRWLLGECANWYKGGWWFNSCTDFNLNGVYYHNVLDESGPDRITWDYSFAAVEMLEIRIRPKV